jgi:hypothetical protein
MQSTTDKASKLGGTGGGAAPQLKPPPFSFRCDATHWRYDTVSEKALLVNQ